jgi:hemerythrin superfamily protein
LTATRLLLSRESIKKQVSDMDAIELLVAQHRALEALFGEVLEAADETSRDARFARAGDELTTHLSAEELLFLPRREGAPD